MVVFISPKHRERLNRSRWARDEGVDWIATNDNLAALPELYRAELARTDQELVSGPLPGSPEHPRATDVIRVPGLERLAQRGGEEDEFGS